MIINGDYLAPSVGNNISVPNNLGIEVGGVKVGHIGSDFGAFRGNVVQCKITRYDIKTSVATGTGVGGVEMTGLRVAITPKFVNSMILCNFFVFGEGSSHDLMYIVYKNGSIPTGDYAGFNKESGLVQWSGIASTGDYDAGDYNSTPHNTMFPYHDFPNTLNEVIYGVGIKTSSASSITYYINRTLGSTGTTVYETGVSYSIAWEIAQ